MAISNTSASTAVIRCGCTATSECFDISFVDASSVAGFCCKSVVFLLFLLSRSTTAAVCIQLINTAASSTRIELVEKQGTGFGANTFTPIRAAQSTDSGAGRGSVYIDTCSKIDRRYVIAFIASS